MRGKAHSEETRAAVMAALLTGQSVSEVAKQFKLSVRTISTWGNSSQFAEVRTKKEHRVPQLVGQHLETLLEAMTGIVRNASTSEYIAKQPASEVAVLYGVMADKAFRLLSATPAGERDDANPDDIESETAA